MPPHLLTDFEKQKLNQNNSQRSSKNEPRFNGVYSRNNLPKIKDGAYVINLDESSDIGTHGIALYALNNSATYFDSFGDGNIPKVIKTFINKSTVAINISRILGYDLIMCGYFCVGFIDFMLAGKTLTLPIFFSRIT